MSRFIGQPVPHGCSFSERSWHTENFSDISFRQAGLSVPETIQRSVPKRRQEFFYGRLSARQAIRQLKVDFDGQIPMAKDRQPVWPDGLVGSITHCANYAAAMIASRSDYHGLGIDAETVMPEQQASRLADSIATPAELARLAVQVPDLATQVSLLFSAKESIYKALYPVTRQFLEFHDVELIDAGSPGELVFTVDTGSPGGAPEQRTINCCFGVADGLVSTVVLLPANGGNGVQ